MSVKPYELKTLRDHVREEIKSFGFNQHDERMKRNTRYVLGYRLSIDDGNLVRWLKGEKTLPKYADDWKRMSFTFENAVHLASQDGDSRRLVIFNAEFTHKDIEQCFTQMQFVKDHAFESDEFVLIVTQRSADVTKFDDDLVFFGSICRKWEIALKTKVRRIIINYGNLHYEI